MIDEILSDIEQNNKERFKKGDVAELEKQIDDLEKIIGNSMKELKNREKQREAERQAKAEKIRLINEAEAEQEKQYQIWLTDYYKREAQEQLRRDRMRRLGR